MSALKNPARHDDLLNYRLKRLVSLGGAPAIRLCEGGFGVSRQEWRLVAAFVEHGPMTVGQLTATVRLEPARVSRGVKELVRKGLVQRAGAGADQRRVKLSASERGETLYRDLLPRLAAINRRLMAVLSEDEALVLEELLARLTAHAQAIHDEGGGVELKTGRHLGTSRRVPKLRSDPPPQPAWLSQPPAH